MKVKKINIRFLQIATSLIVCIIQISINLTNGIKLYIYIFI